MESSSPINDKGPQDEVSDDELKKVMADFLEMGHVENLAAMYRQEKRYYEWTGEILSDERFNVRLGISVLFEELKETDSNNIHLAIPSLVKLLNHEWETLRGEAISVLAIIGTQEALDHISELKTDPVPQIRDLVNDILDENALTELL